MADIRTDSAISAVAAALGVDDLMVFELRDDGAHLLGGTGRGASWAGVVELELDREPLLAEVVDRRMVRVESAEPVRVVGPYWSAHAALAHAGDHVIVVGSNAPITASSAEIITRATEAAAAVGEIPPSKLLADELEIVHAVRQLTEHVPRNVADTATHVAAVGADALASEIGAVLLTRNGETEVYGAGPAWPSLAGDPVLCAALHDLAARAADGPIVDQDLAAAGESGLRIVSCYALGIGRSEPLGALIVGHTDEHPRGFTQLCQRVGRALADASEPSLRQAIAHEELAAQLDRYALEARTDPLTGLGNRTAWEDTLAIEQARWERHGRPLVVLAVDLNDLKATNDALGHAAGDELLVAAAGILRRSLRGGDVVVRLGGDEFAALLSDTEASAAKAVGRRVTEACASWRGSRPELRLSLSMGWAVPEPGEDLHRTLDRADAAMYDAKRDLGATARP